MKFLDLVTPKITPDVNNFLWFLNVGQDLGDSLHDWGDFWCLIIASTKLM